MKRFGIFLLVLLPLLASCGDGAKKPALQIDNVVSSSDPIDPANSALPEFTQYFGTGTEVVYSYVQLKNVESMTGGAVVRMRWYYPNDFRPPIAQRVVDLQPGQNVAQFSIHTKGGLTVGPYQLEVWAGKNETTLTSSGAARFFVGMNEAAADQYLIDEAEYRRKWEEERKKREEEQKKLEEEKKETGTGNMMKKGESEDGGDEENKEGNIETGSNEQSEGNIEGELPPILTGEE